MKKALKTIFIVILCLAVAGGTSYLFFANMTKTVSAFDSVNNFLTSTNQKDFKLDIQKVATTGGDRFNLFIETYDDMLQITSSLNSYLVDYHNASVETKVESRISNLQSTQNSLAYMAEEYFIKCNNSAYNKLVGANDLYEDFADYIADVAEFVQYLQTKVLPEISTANIDIKFSIFELYANVCKLTLRDLKVDATHNFNNLSYMNQHFTLTNNYISTANANGDFAIDNNKFISLYNECNKAEFATNLSENVNNATSASTTKELQASYYLSIILGA